MKRIFLASLILLTVASCNKNQPVRESEGDISNSTILVTVGDDNTRKDYRINVITKQEQETDRDQFRKEVLTFLGLPKEQKTTTISKENYRTLPSLDKSQAIVIFKTYDLTQPQSEFDGSYPEISSEEYLCLVAQKSCQKSNLIAEANKAGEPATWWHFFDSSKNRLIGSPAGEGVADPSPVQVYDVKLKSVTKTVNNLGFPSYSPSGRKLVFTKDSKLSVYSFDDLSKPTATYDVSEVLANQDQYSRFVNVGWNGTEDMLTVNSSDKIYILNLSSGQFTKMYEDSSIGFGGMSWSRYSKFSEDSKFIVLVDYNGGVGQLPNVLKAISLQTKNIYEVKSARFIDLGPID